MRTQPRLFQWLLKQILQFSWRRSKRVVRFSSMTLDHEDVIIAKRLLTRRYDWFDSTIENAFNVEFARKNESKWAFSFIGGRTALTACIRALGLKSGDVVLVPGYTCIVVPNAFWYEGVRVIFYDIELETFGPDVSDLKRKYETCREAKAVLIHHLYGLVCRDLIEVLDFAKAHGLKVIEDCAHATGATYDGKKVGNFGDVAFYSTEQSKVLNTIVGGVATTNNKLLADKLQEIYSSFSYPDEGLVKQALGNVVLNFYRYKSTSYSIIRRFYTFRYRNSKVLSTTSEELKQIKPAGYDAKMPAALCAIGRNQLKKIEQFAEMRLAAADMWSRWTEDKPVVRPKVIPRSEPVFLRYPILIKDSATKKSLRFFGLEDRFGIGVWFKTNLHPVEFSVLDCPNADYAVKHCINLPTIWN